MFVDETVLTTPQVTHNQSYYASKGILSPKDQKDPKKVGQLFESLFYQMILKEMRKGELEKSLFHSQALEVQQEMWDNELSLTLAAQGKLGISKMVEDYIAEHPQHQAKNSLGLIKDMGG